MRRRDRRRDNRMRRNAARADVARQFVQSVFWNTTPPQRVPGLPNKMRRALTDAVASVGDWHRQTIEGERDRSRREIQALRDLMAPTLSRIGVTILGRVTRHPIIGALGSGWLADPRVREVPQVSTLEVETVDGQRMYEVAFRFAPDILRFATRAAGSHEHLRAILHEVATAISKRIENDMVRVIFFEETIGADGDADERRAFPNVDEIIGKHPRDAFSWTVSVSLAAGRIGDQAAAEHFGNVGLELLRRGWRDDASEEVRRKETRPVRNSS